MTTYIHSTATIFQIYQHKFTQAQVQQTIVSSSSADKDAIKTTAPSLYHGIHITTQTAPPAPSRGPPTTQFDMMVHRRLHASKAPGRGRTVDPGPLPHSLSGHTTSQPWMIEWQRPEDGRQLPEAVIQARGQTYFFILLSR